MESLSFTVEGFPVPKGSMRHVGGGRLLPQGDPAKITAWRTDVRAAAKAAMDGRGIFTGPIRLGVDISLPYPQSSVRKYQMGWLLPTKKPDVDKLLRSICDHLTGIVWADDSQVCSVHLSKSYAWDFAPGAIVDVAELDEQWCRSYTANRARLRNAIAIADALEQQTWGQDE